MRALLILVTALFAPTGCVFWGMSDSRLVAHLEGPYPDYSTSMDTLGDTIFYVTSQSPNPGIAMIDVSDPLAPRLRATVPADVGTSYWPGRHAFAVDDRYVYVLDPDLRIFETSDPAEPISTTPGPGGTLYGMATRGTRVYALTGTTLYTWDVTDPLAPVPGGTVAGIGVDVDNGSLSSTGSWLVIGGRTLYVFDTSAGDPVLVGSATPGSNVTDVEANGTYLYAPNFYSGTMVIDLSTGSPVVSVQEAAPGDPRPWGPIARSGDRFFIGTDRGVYELDVTDAKAPRVGRQITDGRTVDIAVIGSFLYTLGSGVVVTVLP